MRNILKILFIIIMLPFVILSQWQPEISIASNTSLGYPVVASKGDSVYVFWQDNRFGNFEILNKISFDGGFSWGPEIRLTNNSGTSSNPAVYINDSLIHLFWQDNTDGNYEIYYKSSTNAGISWSSDLRMTYFTGNSISCTVTGFDTNLHLAWIDNRDGNNEIYYKRSTNSGLNWESDIRLTNDTTSSGTPSISASGSNVHIIFRDRRIGLIQFFHKKSTDNGITWGEDNQITNLPNAFIGSFSKSAVYGSFIHLLWNDNRSGINELYYARSTNSGLSWQQEKQLTNTSYSSFNPYLSVSGQIVHISCQRPMGSSAVTVYKRSTNNGELWSEDTVIAEDCFYPALNSSSSGVNAVYIKNSPTGYIYFKKNPTGNLIGLSILSYHVPKNYLLFQNYPNPFNPSTKIKFQIKENSKAIIKIYDVLGKEISILVNESLQPGTYEISWDAVNLPSGIYFYSLQTGKYSETRKMTLTK